MAAIVPRNSRTRQHTRRTPPDLNLQETSSSSTSSGRAQTLSNSNSSASINSQRSQLQQQQQHYYQGQGPQRQPSPHHADPLTGGGIGLNQFQTYSAHYPSYRPYTPTTPTTPTVAHALTMPMTPTAAAMGSGFPISPRLEHSTGQNGNNRSAVSTAGGLYPYMNKNQRRSSTTRRIPSNESSLYDPYRSRQSGVSANKVKNEYRSQSPIRENQASTFPQQPQSYYSRHGSSEEVHEIEGGVVTDDQAFVMVPPPSIAQRDDHYRRSPTLTASQTLAATYAGVRSESPFQSYMPYQPYSSYQQPLPSPSILDAYRSSGAFSSPGLGPLHHHHHHEERSSEHKADPYRSAYSHSISSNNNNLHTVSGMSNSFGSPYLGSGKSSPNLNDDFSSSFESRLSGVSSQQHQQQQNNTRYPMRDLAGQESNQALSASFYDQQRKRSTTTATSSEHGGSTSNQGHPATPDSPSNSGFTRLSAQRPSQLSTTDSSGTKKAKTNEDEENDVILQKLGVLSVDSSNGTRSGLSNGSGRSRRKGQWTDEDEEMGHVQAGGRRRKGAGGPTMSRRRRREAEKRCCCCSRRACVLITFLVLFILGVILFFVIPRPPTFVFESVMSTGEPIVTKSRIRERFAIQLLVDSKESYLPIRVDRVDLTIWLKKEQTKIADNDNLSSSFVIQPRTAQVISIPMLLDYRSTAPDPDSDATLQRLVEVCTPVDSWTQSVIPTINITVGGQLHIWGLGWVWKPDFQFQVDKVPCPVNARDPASDTPSPPMVSPVPSVTAIMGSVQRTVIAASVATATPHISMEYGHHAVRALLPGGEAASVAPTSTPTAQT
ncbi:hypothetical protein BGZ50_007113 [Haplosporangium sp. Z 11]|nr:hypothetical protein BGZ50_007113 [Haplosporangium sp. Z 11]